MNVRDWEGFSSSPGSLMEIIFSSWDSYLLVNGQARLTHCWKLQPEDTITLQVIIIL